MPETITQADYPERSQTCTQNQFAAKKAQLAETITLQIQRVESGKEVIFASASVTPPVQNQL